MSAVKRLILGSGPMQLLFKTADSIILPGFDGLSLFQIGKFFFKEIKNNKLNVRTAAVTYNFLAAMPPTLLFLFSLVSYLPLKNIQKTILGKLQLVISNKALYKSVSDVIVNFMNTEHKDILSFGILLTLFFSSNGMMGLMNSFDRSLSFYKERGWFKRRWTAIKLTFMLICVVLMAIGVFTLQTEFANHWLKSIFGNPWVIKISSSALLILIIFFSISFIYRYGPSLTQNFRFISAGSVFATIMIVTGTVVFFFLVNHFLNYNRVYGSIGTLIAFMVWIWLNTLFILIGYELNVSIYLGKISRTENEAKLKQTV